MRCHLVAVNAFVREVFSMPQSSFTNIACLLPHAGHIGVQHTSHLPHTSPQLLSAFIRSLAGDCLETHRRRHFSLCEVCSFLHFHAKFLPVSFLFWSFSSHSPLLHILWSFFWRFLTSIFSACMSLRFTHCYSSSLACHLSIVTSSLLLAAFPFLIFVIFVSLKGFNASEEYDPEAATLI